MTAWQSSKIIFISRIVFWRVFFVMKGYYRAAKCHLVMGSIGNATNYLQKVLEKDPKNKDAQNDVSIYYYTCRPLVKFIWNYIRDRSGIFFDILTSEGVNDIISHLYMVVSFNFYSSRDFCQYNKITRCLKIWISFSCVKNSILLIPVLTCKILFLPLENKIHIFALPRNYLSIYNELLDVKFTY